MKNHGLFLEHHRFSQTITPMSPDCYGFVVLGRLLQKSPSSEEGSLSLIAVEIPYNYTLIIRDGSIHGDATLVGDYMMGMSSSHTDMATADTVFLRTKNNLPVKMRMEHSDRMAYSVRQEGEGLEIPIPLPPPFISYDSSPQSWEELKERLKGESVIFDPFSEAYQKYRSE